jgi:predicted dehydrogenase
MPGRFHPSTRRVKEIVESGELGDMTKIEASLAVPAGFIKADDIRLVYDLGGGAMMDMGCEFDSVISRVSDSTILAGYPLSMARYLAGADPTKVISAKAEIDPKFPRVDVGTTATLAFPTPSTSSGPADGLTATLTAHLRLPPWLGFLPQWPKVSVRVTGTRGTAELYNYPGPWLYHYITVESSEHEGGPMRKRTEKHYGERGWTTQVSLCLFVFCVASDVSRLCL